MNIGVLIIATGNYTQFLNPLMDSIVKYFLKGNRVSIITYSDKKPRTFKMDHKPFPYPTLMRYHQFNKSKDLLKTFDYLFYIDADMLFCSQVGNEILGDGLTAITHPYSESRNMRNTFENNKDSTAYLEDVSKINPYCCGGFQGGTSEAFLKMSKVIADNIDKDLEKGIVARWHDETHYNKYLTKVKPSLILSSDYCTPEKEKNEKSKLIALDKNHKEIRL